MVDDTAIELCSETIAVQQFHFLTIKKYQQKYQQKILLGVFWLLFRRRDGQTATFVTEHLQQDAMRCQNEKAIRQQPSA